MVVKRSHRRDDREIVHIERLAHAIQQRGHLRMAHGIADAQAREAVDLGEGARHDQVGKTLDPGDRWGSASPAPGYSL